jgi:hypothetical protein
VEKQFPHQSAIAKTISMSNPPPPETEPTIPEFQEEIWLLQAQLQSAKIILPVTDSC